MPRVSVILTSFNHERFIREAIDSVLAQTFDDYELLIWDDASKDDSWHIIQSYRDPRIRAFRNDEQRRGIWGINKAVAEIATGEYVAIHHSDDLWEPEKLEKQVAFLDGHADIGAVFTNARAINEDGSILADEKHFYYGIFDQPNRTRHEWLRFFFEHGNALCHPSVLIRKTCYDVCGTYRFGLAQLGDFDMWVRLCTVFDIHVLQEKLVRFRVRASEANTSGNRPDARMRILVEYRRVLSNYRLIDNIGDLQAVFPSAARFDRGAQTDLVFALAMAMLNEPGFFLGPLYGLELLFEILSDKDWSEKIKELYGFDYRDLIVETGRHDFFSREEVAGLWGEIHARDARADSLHNELEKTKEVMQLVERKLAERDEWLGERDARLAERDVQLAEKDARLGERDARLAERDVQLAERDARLAERDVQLAERDVQLAERDVQLAERDARLAERDARLGERDAQLAARDAQLAERDVRLTDMLAALMREQGLANEMKERMLDFQSRYLDICSSKSYRVGRFVLMPFRVMKRIMHGKRMNNG